MSAKINIPSLMNEPPISVYPSLAKALGDVNKAIIVQQLHFLLSITKGSRNQYNFVDGHWWVYNTYEEWNNIFTWVSIRTLKTLFKSLEDMGVVKSISGVKNKLDRRKWYRINYDILADIALPIVQKLHDEHSAELAQSEMQELHDVNRKTETTSETTSETTHTPAPSGLGSKPDPAGIVGLYAKLEAEADKPVENTVEEKSPATATVATPLTPVSGQPPSPPPALDMTRLRDVVANKWFKLTSPKYETSAPAKTLTKIDGIVSRIVLSSLTATKEQFAWAALEFWKHWSAKTTGDGQKLSMPLDPDKFETHWNAFLDEHPEVKSVLCGESIVSSVTSPFQSFKKQEAA